MFDARLRLLRAVFFLAAFAASSATAAYATPDFYGVKMKSEDFAQNVFLIDHNEIPDFTNNRPGTDKRIYAYAYMSSVLGGGRGIALEVFNHSDEPIATEKLFRELTIVTYDGHRYDRAETEMMWSSDRLRPGEHATFNFAFPGIRVEKEEVRMVIGSFDMGETMIFLFPLRAPEKTASAPAKKIVKKQVVKEQQKKPVTLIDRCVTPVKLVQSFFRGIGDRLSGKEPPAGQYEEVVAQEAVEQLPPADKNVPPDYPLVEPDQVIEGVHYHFRPHFRKEVQEAQKQVEKIVYRDRPWSLENPDKLFTHDERVDIPSEGFPRREAKVLIANLDYGFIVVDAGLEQGFGKNVVLSVFRDGRRIGKAMITKPRDSIAGAILLPEWRTRDEVRVGDIAGVSA